MRTLFCLLLAAASLAAQADFLTADEIDRVREAQEPNARLALYASFARQRLDLIKNLLSKDRPGRAVMIHDALDGYTKILDAIDDVADEALTKKQDVKKGLSDVERADYAILTELRKIEQSRPNDLDRYAFSLTQAIEATSDSLDASREDLAERALDVEAREAREKKAEDAASSVKSDQKAATEQKQDNQKKAPTLMRPGEKKKQ